MASLVVVALDINNRYRPTLTDLEPCRWDFGSLARNLWDSGIHLCRSDVLLYEKVNQHYSLGLVFFLQHRFTGVATQSVSSAESRSPTSAPSGPRILPLAPASVSSDSDLNSVSGSVVSDLLPH